MLQWNSPFRNWMIPSPFCHRIDWKIEGGKKTCWLTNEHRCLVIRHDNCTSNQHIRRRKIKRKSHSGIPMKLCWTWTQLWRGGSSWHNFFLAIRTNVWPVREYLDSRNRLVHTVATHTGYTHWLHTDTPWCVVRRSGDPAPLRRNTSSPAPNR